MRLSELNESTEAFLKRQRRNQANADRQQQYFDKVRAQRKKDRDDRQKESERHRRDVETVRKDDERQRHDRLRSATKDRLDGATCGEFVKKLEHALGL